MFWTENVSSASVLIDIVQIVIDLVLIVFKCILSFNNWVVYYVGLRYFVMLVSRVFLLSGQSAFPHRSASARGRRNKSALSSPRRSVLPFLCRGATSSTTACAPPFLRAALSTKRLVEIFVNYVRLLFVIAAFLILFLCLGLRSAEQPSLPRRVRSGVHGNLRKAVQAGPDRRPVAL